MRALLFDIDGTLTGSGGAGARALAHALGTRSAERAGAELTRMKLDGMTDRSIVRALLAAEHPDSALPVEERAVGAVHVLAPDIEDAERPA